MLSTDHVVSVGTYFLFSVGHFFLILYNSGEGSNKKLPMLI